MNVMVWLANQQSKLGRGLKAGDIVSTGTCTGLDSVEPGDHVVAEFGSLGRVEIEVAAPPARSDCDATVCCAGGADEMGRSPVAIDPLPTKSAVRT